MQSHFLSLFLLCIFTALSLAAPLARRSGAGQATYYAPGLGACGQYNTASDLIGAVAVGLGKGVCGSKVQITRPTTGQTVEITITDLCQACGPNDLDLTEAAFEKLGTLAEGRIDVSWAYLSASASAGGATAATGAGTYTGSQ